MSSETSSVASIVALALAASFTLRPVAAADTTRQRPQVGAAAQAPERSLARELTARARDRFDAGDYAQALAEFSRAYDALEGHPRRAELLNNIAVCHERMFRYDLALHFYGRYLQEGTPTPEDRHEVEEVIDGLRELLGKVYVTSNVRAELWVDDRVVGHAPGMIAVPAGARTIEARAPGYQSARSELLVVARDTRNLHVQLEPLPEYRGLHRAYFWTGTALTGAALVSGAAVGLRALAKQRDAERLEQRELLTLETQESVRNLALGADIAFGSAALLAVSSTVLLFLTDFRGGKGARRPDRVEPRDLRAQLLVGAGGLGMTVGSAW